MKTAWQCRTGPYKYFARNLYEDGDSIIIPLFRAPLSVGTTEGCCLIRYMPATAEMDTSAAPRDWHTNALEKLREWLKERL